MGQETRKTNEEKSFITLFATQTASVNTKLKENHLRNEVSEQWGVRKAEGCRV